MTTTSAYESSIASLLRVEAVISYAWIAATTVYSYDRCLTFEREVELVWRRRRPLSVVTGLYMLLHISATMFLYLTVIAMILTSCKRCASNGSWFITLDRVRISSYVITIVQSCALPVFRLAYGSLAALRAYAISGHSLPLAMSVFLLGLISPAVDIYEYSKFYMAAVLPQHLGCLMNVRVSQREERILNTAADVCDIASEAILVIVTWRHAHRMGRLPDGSRVRTPLATSLVQNGTMCFIAILVMTLANAAMTIPKSNAYDGVLTAPTTALQAILISRFYLNLRTAALPDADETTTGPGSRSSSSVWFDRVAGEVRSISLSIDASHESRSQELPSSACRA